MTKLQVQHTKRDALRRGGSSREQNWSMHKVFKLKLHEHFKPICSNCHTTQLLIAYIY